MQLQDRATGSCTASGAGTHPRSFSFTSVTSMKGSSCWTSHVKKIGPSRDAKSKDSLVPVAQHLAYALACLSTHSRLRL